MAGLLLHRIREHRLLLAAALLAVVLTTAVLATLTAFTATVGDAGLRQTLTRGSAARAALVVKADVTADGQPGATAAVRDAARRAYDGLPTRIRTLTRSDPYALPATTRPAAARKQGRPDLTHFAALDRSRVELARGRWPTAAGRDAKSVSVALPEAAAAALKLAPGDRLKLAARMPGKPPLTVRLAGVWRPKDRGDPYWQLDELGGRGLQTVDFTTYGPLLADPGSFASGRVPQASAAWLATGDFAAVTGGRTGELSAAMQAAVKDIPKLDGLGGSGVTAQSQLPDVLADADRALLVNRSSILIVALQLVLLAGYALLLVARLLAAARDGETDLLRARGGSRWRITALAAGEAALLALPAAVAAPLLAGPLTGALSGHGALARLGLDLDTRVTGGTWLVGVAAAAGCALAVVAPTLARTGRKQSKVRRLPAVPGVVKAGADIGLLVIAGVAYWQLDRQTSDGAGVLGSASPDGSGASPDGAFGVDPVLVAAPALALLAGTVVTLRLLPPVARLAERRAAAGRGLPAALAGWQLSRRPMRGAGPVLLLVLAVAMGMLAIGQAASWERSQADQADFRAGADVRVSGMQLPPLGQGGALAGLPHLRAAAPAARLDISLAETRSATVLALDTAAGGGMLRLRGDLADRPADGVLRELAPSKPQSAGAKLPGTPDKVRLRVRLDGGKHGGAERTAQARATFADAAGSALVADLGQVTADGSTRTLTADIGAAVGAPEGRVKGPLRLTGLRLVMSVPGKAEQHRLTLAEVRTVAAGGEQSAPVRLPDAGRWRGQAAADIDEAEPHSALPKAGKPAGGGDALTVTYDTGSQPASRGWYGTPPPLDAGLVAAPPPASMPRAAATGGFLDSAGAKPGSVVSVPVGGGSVKVKIVETLRALPTTGPDGGAGEPDGGALLVDFRALNSALAAKGLTPVEPGEWWLAARPGNAAALAGELRARGDVDPERVIERAAVARELRDDPLGAGRQTALTAVAVVAAALAALGFAVSVAGSLRERAAELAVLRALGAPRRQLARMIAAEQGVLLALALTVGVVLGAVLTRSVLPLISLTAQATKPVPELAVQLPAGQVALLLAGVMAVPLLIVVALALRRSDPAAELRGGGE
ncbi:FtsX-like permease family protein [Streptomyces boninensis]|uniref:ABC transporter permease n=1 Tax=Streptomyces boninensis TaxID=2039455 RepID=UPI003B20CB06